MHGLMCFDINVCQNYDSTFSLVWPFKYSTLWGMGVCEEHGSVAFILHFWSIAIYYTYIGIFSRLISNSTLVTLPGRVNFPKLVPNSQFPKFQALQWVLILTNNNFVTVFPKTHHLVQKRPLGGSLRTRKSRANWPSRPRETKQYSMTQSRKRPCLHRSMLADQISIQNWTLAQVIAHLLLPRLNP